MIRAGLRFPIADLEEWASKYEAHDDWLRRDLRAETAADTAKKHGSMTKEEFLTVTMWKSPRPKHRLEENTADDIKDATHSAFSTTNARVRIGVLMTLRGVSYPMASAILHLVCKEVVLVSAWDVCVHLNPIPLNPQDWTRPTEAQLKSAKRAMHSFVRKFPEYGG